MPYQKKYKTDAERSLAKSLAGKKGAAALKASGNFRGGRPKGSTNKNPSVRVPTRTLTVREPDYQVLVRLANYERVSQAEFLHIIAEWLKEKNKDLGLFADLQK